MKRALAGATLFVAMTAAGCASSPVNYTATLSTQDPKWQSPQCVEARKQASDYSVREKQHMGWGGGLLFGPYGIGLVTAIKEHERKERKQHARQIHLQCSSQPLPDDLQADANANANQTKYP